MSCERRCILFADQPVHPFKSGKSTDDKLSGRLSMEQLSDNDWAFRWQDKKFPGSDLMKCNYGKTEKNDIFRRVDKEAERDGIKSKRKVWFRNDETERSLCKKERREEKRTAQSCWKQYKNIWRDHGIYLFWGRNKLNFGLFWWEKSNLSVTFSGSSRLFKAAYTGKLLRLNVKLAIIEDRM